VLRLRYRSIATAMLMALLLNGAVTMVSAGERIAAVAVFPVDNLSGGTVPGEDLRRFLIDSLTSDGIRVLGDRELDQFMARHRVRYAAGLDGPTAAALAQEAGVDAVLIPAFELANQMPPPKVAVMARLISVKGTPSVIWADDAGLAGDDAPGLFGLGLVNDYEKLLSRAFSRLSESLLAYIKTGQFKEHLDGASKFKPKMWYRELSIEPHAPYAVAVVPFVNLTDRRNAGELLASLFMRHLSRRNQFRVIDTGVVRAELLNARIIMEGGLSVADAETVAALIDADFVLGGRVLRYADYEGAGGIAKVEFSTVLIDRKTRRVVWSSDSYNEGSDGVHFFERGGSKTAHVMATQMVRLTTDMIAGREH
jgi:TolB-like protein